MKKVLAIILSIVMLFGVFAMSTSAATQPTVTVDSIEVELGKESDLTVTLDNFSDVKGMDLTISTEGDVEFKSISADVVTLDATNSTVAAKEIRIVDLVSAAKVVLTIKAVVNAEAEIKVTGDLAESGEKLFAAVNATGSITELALEPVVKVEAEKAESNVIATPNKYFIPYGALYNKVDGEYIFPEKDENGNFSVTAGTEYSYTQYLIPESGIMTFGVSDAEVDEKPAVQFGTFCNADTTDRATLVVAGDVAELFALFEGKLTNAALAEKLLANFDKYSPNGEYTNVKMTFNGGANEVRVYKVAQTKYMWQGTDSIEYAVRAYNLTEGEKYAAIGFYKLNDKLTFADTFKVN